MSRYTPANGTAGLARCSVRSSRRPPAPPASTRTRILGRAMVLPLPGGVRSTPGRRHHREGPCCPGATGRRPGRELRPPGNAIEGSVLGALRGSPRTVPVDVLLVDRGPARAGARRVRRAVTALPRLSGALRLQLWRPDLGLRRLRL